MDNLNQVTLFCRHTEGMVAHPDQDSESGGEASLQVCVGYRLIIIIGLTSR